MNVPCILPAKKRAPPPAKADCVSASGKTRPFAPTGRADFPNGLVQPPTQSLAKTPPFVELGPPQQFAEAGDFFVLPKKVADVSGIHFRKQPATNGIQPAGS